MKEWNMLLNGIDSFVYDFDKEEIVFDSSEHSAVAKEIYDSFIKTYNIDKNPREKWAFDIALDCVRNMNDKDKEYLTESYEIDFFGYGLYIRNKYIHCSKVHKELILCPDGQCSEVLGFIYTILHRYYNCFNAQLCELLGDGDYKRIIELYSKRFAFIEELTLQLAEISCKKGYKEVLVEIKNRIRSELGRNGFKDIFVSVIKECGKDCLAPQSWLDLTNKLYDKTPVYNKEYHQVQALKEIGLIRDLTSEYPLNKLESVEECKAYIDEKIGFNDDDAQLLAETMWEAFML